MRSSLKNLLNSRYLCQMQAACQLFGRLDRKREGILCFFGETGIVIAFYFDSIRIQANLNLTEEQCMAKLITQIEAAKLIHDGDTVMFGGFMGCGNPHDFI
ncbi:MAG: hypothetical protein IJ751_05255, partial [Oscillospiraceae bacterium]|nr:hypothetical protein [Oscillospiraceae bacterium]